MKSLRNPACQQELRARLAQLTPGTARLWGTMTAGQMICHLRDCFDGVMGDKPMEIPKGSSLLKIFKPVVLYMPLKWPPGVRTRPEFDQNVGGTPPTDFRADMAGLLASMDKFIATPRPFQFRPHPMFGRMSERDWMHWAYRHTDHHLRQFGL